MGNSIIFSSQENTLTMNSGLPSSRLNLILNSLHLTNSNNTNDNKQNKKSSQFNHISFASHFIIAGRRFKNIINQTQAFLFGDQLDLSFILAHKPVVVSKNNIGISLGLRTKRCQLFSNLSFPTILHWLRCQANICRV